MKVSAWSGTMAGTLHTAASPPCLHCQRRYGGENARVPGRPRCSRLWEAPEHRCMAHPVCLPFPVICRVQNSGHEIQEEESSVNERPRNRRSGDFYGGRPSCCTATYLIFGRTVTRYQYALSRNHGPGAVIRRYWGQHGKESPPPTVPNSISQGRITIIP